MAIREPQPEELKGIVPEVDDEGWQEQTANFYKFENAGDTLIGKLVDTGSVTFTRGDNVVEVGTYTLETPDGRVKFLGGVSLDSLMKPVDIGKMVKLIFEGMEKTKGGNNVKIFKLYTK